MITRGKMIFAIIGSLVCGLIFSFEAFHVFAVRNAPIVTGHIVARSPIRQYSVPRVDFTIQIEGSDTAVHAHTARYLINKIPDTVRFHYNGDPLREVFLFEHEENPYWIVLFLWGAALGLALSMRSARVRHALGWKD
jgi:hypothetical protein